MKNAVVREYESKAITREKAGVLLGGPVGSTPEWVQFVDSIAFLQDTDQS